MDLENDVKRATEDFPDTVERLPPLNYASAQPNKSRIPVPIREKPPSPGPGRFEGFYSNNLTVNYGVRPDIPSPNTRCEKLGDQNYIRIGVFLVLP